jgi:hypothetical protein
MDPDSGNTFYDRYLKAYSLMDDNKIDTSKPDILPIAITLKVDSDRVKAITGGKRKNTIRKIKLTTKKTSKRKLKRTSK